MRTVNRETGFAMRKGRLLRNERDLKSEAVVARYHLRLGCHMKMSRTIFEAVLVRVPATTDISKMTVNMWRCLLLVVSLERRWTVQG